MRTFKYFLLFVFSAYFIACSEENIVETQVERGKLVNAALLTEFTKEQLQQTMALAQIETDLALKYSFKLYKITYTSITPSGESTILSGAVFVPVTTAALPLFSFQHGTQAKRNEVVSNKFLFLYEGITGGIGASLGYVSCIPDYLGMGDSQLTQAYLDNKTSAATVVDIILATREFCSKNNIILNNKNFIGGYSQGGYVTMAAQKSIEEDYSDKITLTASAPMAGPFDMENMFNGLLASGEYSSPGLPAFLLYAYNTYYKIADLSAIFASPYAAKINGLFNGSKTIGEINPELTTDLKLLFTPSFFTNFLENKNSALWTAVKQNEVLTWTPKSPILLLHSKADGTVPYANSEKAAEYFKSKGFNKVTLMPLDGLDHIQAAVPATLAMFAWFQTY